MKLFIKVKTNSKNPGIEQIDATHFIVRVNEAPIDGKANEAVIEVLADFVHIPKSNFKLISGHKSKNKILSTD